MWRHEIATAAIVLETEIRAAGDRDLRPPVPEILLEPSRPGRAHGGAGLIVDHTSIWRWVQAYGPEVNRRLYGIVKPKSSTWQMDETFVRIAGKWMYLFRAVDARGQTID